MKHTKGAWQVGDLIDKDYEPRFVEVLGNDGIKCIAKAVYGKTDEEAATNAHLIAAAPELLKACESILFHINSSRICEQINNEDAELLSEAAADIYKAINKAHGN